MKNLTLAGTLVSTIMLGIGSAQASPYVPVINPTPPIPTLHVPLPPDRHPGKEYSHELDQDNTGAIDSQQNIMWDGTGGTDNTFDYNNSPGTPPDGNNAANQQVDAVAALGDTLYGEVITNQTAILYSTRVQTTASPNTQGAGADSNATSSCGNGDPVCYETTGGAIGTWTTWDQVNDMGGTTNLDGLEVWGAEGIDDGALYSLYDDVSTGTSIYAYDSGTGLSSEFIAQADLAAAVVPFLSAELGILFDVNDIDLDAMMVLSGNEILLSLWPIFDATGATLLTGDLALVWNVGTGIDWLNHGGHLWTDGWLGENVDALEAAAPTPEAIVLLSLGLAGLSLSRRKKLESLK
jgi:hypothetical protein